MKECRLGTPAKSFFGNCVLVLTASFILATGRAQTPDHHAALKTKVTILGVAHSMQLVAETYQPAVFTAFYDRVKPDVICIERSPEEFARNDFYEFTYEQQYLTIPYAKARHIPIYPVDWIPSSDATLLAFGLPDLDRPLFIRRESGFLGFQSFTDKADLTLDIFSAETETDRQRQKSFANTPAPEAAFDFPRRLFLYRTYLQAKRILRVANDNPGKTVLVVIGSNHKTDIEEILKAEATIEVVQPSSFGQPDEQRVAQAITRADLLAVATFNLLGIQAKTGVVNWDWIKRVLERLESGSVTSEVLLLKTRWQVLTKQIAPLTALANYKKALELVREDEQSTWNGVKDRSRVDSYFDPFGNLSIKQRIYLEMARENYKLQRVQLAEDIRAQLQSQLSAIKAQQLVAYWDLHVLRSP